MVGEAEHEDEELGRGSFSRENTVVVGVKKSFKKKLYL